MGQLAQAIAALARASIRRREARRDLDEAIMDYIDRSIAERGGTGRRLSKIQLEMAFPSEDAEFAQAIRRLERAGRIRIDADNAFGFVYAVPTKTRSAADAAPAEA